MPEFGTDISGNRRAIAGPRKNLTEVQRSAILAASSAGMTRAKIARQFAVNAKTVDRTLRRWQEHNTLQSLPKSGRPEKLSDRGKRFFNLMVRRDPRVKWREILGSSDVRVSKNTVRRALQPGYKRKWRAMKRIKLTEAAARKRLSWATYWKDRAQELTEVWQI